MERLFARRARAIREIPRWIFRDALIFADLRFARSVGRGALSIGEILCGVAELTFLVLTVRAPEGAVERRARIRDAFCEGGIGSRSRRDVLYIEKNGKRDRNGDQNP